MGSNIIELAKLGHERSAELKASCGAVDVRSLAQLISDLATQLEVQFVRSTNIAVQLANAESKCMELAAENAGLNAAFDRPDAWLSWHSIPPTFYEPDRGGEYLQVHEHPGEKNDDGSDSWAVYSKPESETPATDAFLAEVRAQGVEMFAAHCQKRHGEMMKSEPNEAASNQAITATRRAGEFAMYFADQLRKGAAL